MTRFLKSLGILAGLIVIVFAAAVINVIGKRGIQAYADDDAKPAPAPLVNSDSRWESARYLLDPAPIFLTYPESKDRIRSDLKTSETCPTQWSTLVELRDVPSTSVTGLLAYDGILIDSDGRGWLKPDALVQRGIGPINSDLYRVRIVRTPEGYLVEGDNHYLPPRREIPAEKRAGLIPVVRFFWREWIALPPEESAAKKEK